MIRRLTPDDAEELAAVLAAERAALEATSPAGFLGQDAATLREAIEQTTDPRFAMLADDGRMIGAITITNAVLGPFRSANVGYWVAASERRRGHATAALADVCRFAFGEAGLHRLEAGTLVDNVPSQRVLERNGFTRIGISPRHLEIAGEWRDHVLFSRVADG